MQLVSRAGASPVLPHTAGIRKSINHHQPGRAVPADLHQCIFSKALWLTGSFRAGDRGPGKGNSRDSQVNIWQVHPLSQLDELCLQVAVMRASPLRVDDFSNLHGTHGIQQQRQGSSLAVEIRRAPAASSSMNDTAAAHSRAPEQQSRQPAAGAAALHSCFAQVSTYHI